jgi:hypothetical protein
MRDNTTVAGLWRSTQFGAGTSSATAGSLVGAGIKAINSTLNQSMAVTTLITNFAVGASDRSSAFLWAGGAGTITLPAAATVGNDWFFHIRNGGTGAVSVVTTGGELINGSSQVDYNPGDSSMIVCDGSGYFTIGFGQAPEFLFDYVSISLTGASSPYVLTGTELNRIAYKFSGTLTANMEIWVPATIQQYWVDNSTTGGSFTLTVKTSAGTGPIVNRNARAILYCDGVDVVLADTANISLPVLISQGGTGSSTASGARINLGATSIGNALFTAVDEATARTAIIAAKSGANSDITSLTGLTTPLSVSRGGTGATTFTANRILKGNGASAVSASILVDDGSKIGVTSTGVVDYAAKFTVNGGTVASELNFAAGAAEIAGYRSLGTNASKTSVGSNTDLARFSAYGYDGTSYVGAGYILFRTDNTVSTGVIPTRISFHVGSPSGGQSEAMRITSAGNVGIGVLGPTEKFSVQGNIKIFSGGIYFNDGSYQISAAGAVTNGGTGTNTQFTAGSIVFAGPSGVYSQDQFNLFWDDSNNRLGLLTNAPAYPLDVNGSARIGGALRGTSGSTASSSIVTPTSDTTNQYNVTALAAGATIDAPSGTPLDGQNLTIRIKDNGVARALTWTTGSFNSYRVIGVTLPTTTVANKTVYVRCIYNSADSRWDVIGVHQEL